MATAHDGAPPPTAPPPLFRCAPASHHDERHGGRSVLGTLPPPPKGFISASDALRDPSSLDESSSTASAALLRTIHDDNSATAIQPTDPTLLERLLAAVGLAVFASVNVRTRKKDVTAWGYWSEFTNELGTPAMRSDATENFEVNVILFAMFIFWLAHMKMKPREKHRRLCKPSSIMGNVYGVLRTLRYNGVRLDIMPRLAHVVTKMTEDFAMAYGYEALAPKQREPFTNTEVDGMLRTDNGTAIASRLVPELQWDSWFGVNFEAAIGISRDGGFRLAEWTSDEFHPMSMSRACLFFIIGGIVYRCPSDTVLASMADGDLAGLLVGPCKNDRFAISFFNHPLYFKYRTGVRNTASALRNLELKCPCRPEDRRRRPLLSRDSSFNPVTAPLARAALNAVMQHIPAAVRQFRSWHAFRVRLACLLQLCGASESLILALLRWKSPKSLLVYARRNPQELAAWLDKTLDHEVASVRGANLPSPLAQAMASVPNSLTAPSYDVLFTAQSRTFDDSACESAANDIHHLQLDGADFIMGLRQQVQTAAADNSNHRTDDESHTDMSDDDVPGADDASDRETSDDDDNDGPDDPAATTPTRPTPTPLQRLYEHLLSPALLAVRDQSSA